MNRLVVLGLIGFLLLITLFRFVGTETIESAVFNAKQEVPIHIRTVTISNLPGNPLRQVDFASPTVAWGIQNGNLVLTTDGGKDWKLMAAATSVPTDFAHIAIKDEFWKVVSLNDDSAIALQGDSIIRTMDGGKSWNRVELSDVAVSDFTFVDSDNGWLVGDIRPAGTPEWTPTLFSSKNGGRTWSKIKVFSEGSEAIGTWWNVWDKGGDVWIVGNPIFRSIDRGKTWTEIEPCDDIYGTAVRIGFMDELHGWLLTNQGSAFCVTRDGGSSWETRKFPEGLRDRSGLLQVSAEIFLAYGANGVFVTADGANTWEKVVDGYFFDGQYLPENKTWIFAGDSVIQISFES